jgi:glycine cleavage system transcriptional repressor
MRTYAISAMGADRPGIIAAVAAALVPHGVNVTDSQMGILRGHFAMTLIVTAPDGLDDEALAADLASVSERLGLEVAVVLKPVEEMSSAAADVPTHTITVHGADHPGILAAVTAALAAESANVIDLQTRLVGDVWMMFVEAAVPDETALRDRLDAVAAQQDVEVALRAAEADVL